MKEHFLWLLRKIREDKKVLRLKPLRERIRVGWLLLLKIEVGFVQVRMLCIDDLLVKLGFVVDGVFAVLNVASWLKLVLLLFG